MSWRLPLAVFASGLLIAVVGFGYDLAFAGIPYQDPTPKMAADYRFHSSISSIIEVFGLVVLMLGFFGMLVLALRSVLGRNSA